MEIMADLGEDDREDADVASLFGQEENVYSVDSGEKMMSVDQLKQEMFKSLRDTGTIEAIRAQLRRRFIEKLKQHGRKQVVLDGSSTNDQEEREKWQVDDQLIHGLIHEYLQRHDMEHTLAVFVPEIGGAQQWLPRDAIVKMLRLPEELSRHEDKENTSQYHSTTTTLLAALLNELQRRLAATTMSSATQTTMDCHDHRIALENQLRRVENSYLAETASHKQDVSVKSFEERVLRYQREYDELCEKRLQEDLVRFKATELALARVEERNKFDREMEALKTTLFKEHRDRLQRLQDRERELEMMFSTRKTELESSLFEARQRLFQEIETLRSKQQDADARSQSETRHVAMEAKRLELLEEKLKVREENLQAAANGMVAEKEQAWQLEKLRWQSDARDREQRLLVREVEAEKGLAAAKQAKDEMHVLRGDVSRLEDELMQAQAALDGGKRTIAKLEAEKKLLHDEIVAREEAVNEDKHSMKSLSYENARLAAELKTVQHEKSRLEDVVVEKSSDAKQLEAEVRDLQHQLINLKLAEANAVVEERKKLMQILENERSDARWKESDLVGKLLELQTRLAESEASREKYQTQYEDEKVHVETLRHEVSSLHTLLAQTQSAVATRQPLGARGSSSARNSEPSDSASERMLMRMMEMMTQMQMQNNGGGGGGAGGRPQWSAPQSMEFPQTTQQTSTVVPARQDEDEAKKLQAEQERREREILDQREYERKKQERDEAERREQELRRKKFDDEMEEERLARAKREQEVEEERRRRAAEQESRFQEELRQQQKAIQDARDVQKRLLDEQIAQEQKRLQDERLREEERARVAKDEADATARRLQRLQEEQAEEEKRNEDEKLRLQREEEEVAAVKERQLREQQQRHEDERVAATQAREAAVKDLEPTEQQVMTTNSREEDDIQALRSGDQMRPVEESAPSPVQLPTAALQVPVVEELQSPADDHSDSESYHSEREPSSTSDTEPNEETANLISQAADTVEASRTEEELPAAEVNPSTLDTAEMTELQVDLLPALPPPKSEEELEEERRQAAEEAKKKEDEDAMDVFRQRVLARRAAEKQRQQELEEQRKREEEERAAAELASSEDELENSGGSFASSAASSSGSF